MLLVNPQHLKSIPGKKTDFKDGERIADLLQHGLLRGSFVPPRPIRELRDLTRMRATLAQERSSIINRIEKTPNLKLGVVASDVVGPTANPLSCVPVIVTVLVLAVRMKSSVSGGASIRAVSPARIR